MRWADLHTGDDDVSRRLIAWARRETTPAFTYRAARYAGAFATDETLDDLLEALEGSAPELAAELAEGLRGNRRLVEPRLDRRARPEAERHRPRARGLGRDKGGGSSVLRTPQGSDLLDQLTRLALQAPARIWRGATRSIDLTTIGLLKQSGRAAAVRTGFREAWPGWGPEERLAAIDLFRRTPWSAFTDESLASFLRAQLGEQWAVRGDAPNEALEVQGKRRILESSPDDHARRRSRGLRPRGPRAGGGRRGPRAPREERRGLRRPRRRPAGGGTRDPLGVLEPVGLEGAGRPAPPCGPRPDEGLLALPPRPRARGPGAVPRRGRRRAARRGPRGSGCACPSDRRAGRWRRSTTARRSRRW